MDKEGDVVASLSDDWILHSMVFICLMSNFKMLKQTMGCPASPHPLCHGSEGNVGFRLTASTANETDFAQD